jgi:hypothetical protein
MCEPEEGRRHGFSNMLLGGEGSKVSAGRVPWGACPHECTA